jgi:hypothetical protein
MITMKAGFENWEIEYLPEDGARISVLKYAGHDLLTAEPADFKPPVSFSGDYETRPVFGYDDCFPTVDACSYPGRKFDCRDHGEICWQKWQTEIKGNTLIFSTGCHHPAVNFKRILTFEGNMLTWRFEVTALSEESSVFLHVMHALLPPDNIIDLEIPECRKIYDEVKSEETGLKSSAELGEFLLSFQPGSFGMLLLRDISEGFVKLSFSTGLKLDIRFDQKLFPTLGIWWNKGGYPESGQLRTECAFEPIPGTCSDLSKSFRDGLYMSVEPGEKTCWEVIWAIEYNKSKGVMGEAKYFFNH